MSSDIHVRFDNIEGDSLDDGHSGEIEALSLSHGMNRNLSSFSSGGSPAQEPPLIQEMVFTKNADKASANLAKAFLQATIIPTATVTVSKPDGQGGKIPYVKYDFEKAVISSYSMGTSTGAAPLESVSFAFAKITLTYTHTTADSGAAEGELTAGWDLQLNKPV